MGASRDQQAHAPLATLQVPHFDARTGAVRNSCSLLCITSQEHAHSKPKNLAGMGLAAP